MDEGMYISVEALRIAAYLATGTEPVRGNAGLLKQVDFVFQHAALGPSLWARVETVECRDGDDWHYEYIVVNDGEPEP